MVDFHNILYGGNAIQGVLDVIIFNLIFSTILKWLKFRIVSWRHGFQPCAAMVRDYLIVGLLCLYHIKFLANSTMATIAYNLL
jgi:hypothetical protein